jgi:hypothetical protein
MKKTLLLLGIIFQLFAMNSQTIVSQNFEAPLVGWVTDGTVTSAQNSITPLGGSAMLSLNANGYLESPVFSLPAGAKHLSFWLNSNMIGTNIDVKLSQNNSPVLTLGSFQNGNLIWSQKILTIPTGYTGSNYSVLFEVPLNAHSLHRYYLDDISVEVGQAPTSILENRQLLEGISVVQPTGLENKIIIKSLSTMSGINLSLYDVNGKMVYSLNDYEITSGEQVINLPIQGEGIYIFNLEKDSKKITRKMILH